MKVTCLILTYNEADRIRFALQHALQWADEVVVVDKSSTDTTPDTARHMGARVATIPFSRQGHEDLATFAAQARHDWIWAFTPGEVPTRELIEAGLRMIGDHVDLIMVPMHYFSFGVHHPRSPWAGGYQPRLYHRRRVQFTGVAHDPIRAARVARIPYSDGCRVLHQTHATADSFIRAHADYAINEAANGTPQEAGSRAISNFHAFDAALESDPSLAGQLYGWKLYWLMVALHAWERSQPLAPGSPLHIIPEQYRARAQQMVTEHWPATR